MPHLCHTDFDLLILVCDYESRPDGRKAVVSECDSICLLHSNSVHMENVLSFYLPGSEGMILSLFSIWPASMGNISFSDFCHQAQNISEHRFKNFIFFCFAFVIWFKADYESRPTDVFTSEQSFYLVVQRNSRVRCGSQDTSCRLASRRGRSISPSACTPAQTYSVQIKICRFKYLCLDSKL